MRSNRSGRQTAASLGIGILAAIALAGGCSPTPPRDMAYVPKGEFIMGSNDVDTEAKSQQYGNRKPWFANEGPEHKVWLKAFVIDKYEVSIANYKHFVDATKREPPVYFKTEDLSEVGNLPIVGVSFLDAKAYCRWEGKRLPTEAEWEKAARGTDGRQFPWGNGFDSNKVNGAGNHKALMEVTSLEAGKSPYGLHHMSGNVYEWTSSWYERYEGNKFDDEDYGGDFMTVRGGSWGGVGHYSLNVYLRTTYRFPAPPTGKFEDVGFRCAKDIE